MKWGKSFGDWTAASWRGGLLVLCVRMSQHRDVRLHHFTESRAGWVKLGSTTSSNWPNSPSSSFCLDPFPRHHPGPPTPSYLLSATLFIQVDHWQVLGCDIAAHGGGCVFIVSGLLTRRSSNSFPLSPPEPMKRFYLQEHLIAVQTTWRERIF